MKKMLWFASFIGFAISVAIGMGLGAYLMMQPSTTDIGIYLLILYASSFLITLLMPVSFWLVALGLIAGQLGYLLYQDDIYRNALWIIGIAFVVIVSFSSFFTCFMGQLLHGVLFRKKNRKP